MHKAVLVKDDTESHIIEELNLLPSSEPIETLLLEAGKVRLIYCSLLSAEVWTIDGISVFQAPPL